MRPLSWLVMRRLAELLMRGFPHSNSHLDRFQAKNPVPILGNPHTSTKRKRVVPATPPTIGSTPYEHEARASGFRHSNQQSAQPRTSTKRERVVSATPTNNRLNPVRARSASEWFPPLQTTIGSTPYEHEAPASGYPPPIQPTPFNKRSTNTSRSFSTVK